MLSLYSLEQSVRIFLIFLVYVGIMAQLGSILMTWYLRQDRSCVWRLIFESLIFLHFIVLCLTVSTIQMHSLGAQLTSPYLQLRYFLMLAPLAGVPLLFEERQNSDALAMIALIFTLPFMENLFGKEYYLSLIFSTMLLLLRALAQLTQLRRTLHTGITRVAMKEAFDSFPQALAIGQKAGRIELMNMAMRDLIVDLNLTPQDMGDLEAQLHARAELLPGPPEIHALRRGDRVWQVQSENFKAPQHEFKLIQLSDISDEAELIDQLKQKNRELIEANDQMLAILNQTEDIVVEREKTRLRNRIHDVMGQRLSILHLYIQQMEDGKAPPLNEVTGLLDSMLEDLAKSARTEASASVEQIRDAAQLVGVQFVFQGKLPAEESKARLLLNIMREAVTNAIRHAQAKQIQAQILEKDDAYLLTVTNDGHPPLFPLSEGDGLSGMRFHLAQEGGSLEIPEKTPFELRITLPKTGAHGS